MTKVFRTVIVPALFLCASMVLITSTSAQSVYGSIFGTVTDKTGAALQGALITVKDEAKGTVVSVTSNGTGDYSVPHLIPDVYDLKSRPRGLRPFKPRAF